MSLTLTWSPSLPRVAYMVSNLFFLVLFCLLLIDRNHRGDMKRWRRWEIWENLTRLILTCVIHMNTSGSKHLLGQLLGHGSSVFIIMCIFGHWTSKIQITLNFWTICTVSYSNTLPINFALQSVMLTMTWLSVATVTIAWTRSCDRSAQNELHKNTRRWTETALLVLHR